MMISGRVLNLKRLSKRREWGVAELETDDGSVRCTGDVAHLSRGDQVSALGHWRTTKWGQEFVAQAILPVVLIPALREIESVIDRFAPPRPSRAAVFGLVIRLGKAAADVMKRDPFRSVDPDHKVSGWGYGHAAQYADLVGIPAGAEVRATAAVRHLWPQLSGRLGGGEQGPAGVAHRDGSRYRRHGGQAVGRSSSTRRAPGVDGRPGGMARGRGGGAIYRERDTQEDGFWGIARRR